MNYLKIISNTSPSLQDRPINPLDFIERWSLCHDLGQVILCLESAACRHRNDTEASLDILRSARQHLYGKYINEHIKLSLRNKDDLISYGVPLFQEMRISPFPMMADAIAKEWSLSNHLKEVIFYITLYKNFYPLFPHMRPVFLKHALKHLEKEINAKKQFIFLTTQ